MDVRRCPIRDPRTGQVLGVVDVSGPAATVHPTTIALVDAVATGRLAALHTPFLALERPLALLLHRARSHGPRLRAFLQSLGCGVEAKAKA